MMVLANTDLIKDEFAQLNVDIDACKEKFPAAPLDLWVIQLKKCLPCDIPDERDYKFFRQAALDMLHHYLDCLKDGDLTKANETLNAFVDANPAPSENLRRILFWVVSLTVGLAVTFFFIPLMICVDPIYGLLFMPGWFIGGLFFITAREVKNKIENSIQCDFDKHIAAGSIRAISRPLGYFFKQQSVANDASEQDLPPKLTAKK